MRATLLICALMFGLPSFADDDPAAKYPDVKKVEADHTKATDGIEKEVASKIRAANDARIASLKEILQKIKTAGDTDKIVLVSTRLKEYEKQAESEKPPSPQKVRILSATYGVNQSWFDVTDKLQAKIGKSNKWSAEVSDKDWGDPAPDYPPGNTLIVRYAFRGKTVLKAVYQGQPIAIP